MDFISGAGATNVDLLYQGFDRLAGVGEELYCKDFSLQLGGGLPATLINLGRLGIDTRIATELSTDIFSEFAKAKFEENNVTPTNLYSGDKIPLNITSAIILPHDRTFYTYGKGSIEPDDKAKEAFYNIASGSKITMMQLGGFLDVYKKLHDEGTILVLDTGWVLKNTTIILKLPITTHRTKKRLCKSQEKAMQKTRHTSSSVTLTKLLLRLTKTAVSELTATNISLLRALTNFTMSTQRAPATPFWQDLCMVYSMITVLKKVFSSET